MPPRLVGCTMVAVLVLSASCTGSSGRHPQIDVNGRVVKMEARTWTVADALKAVDIVPRAGVYLAAVSGRPVGENENPPRIQVNGEPAELSQPLEPDDRIAVGNGADTPEPVDERLAYGDQPPLPHVLTSLWHPGRGPAERQTVGKLSGEVVSRVAFAPAIPPEPETDKVLGLTFDDGPDPRYTPKVLEILADEGVSATFCVVGSSVRRHPDLVKAELDAGHALCNHTMDHAHLPRLSHDKVVKQFADTNAAIVEATGQAPTLCRAPYAELSDDAINVAQEMGMNVLGWNIDPADYRDPSASVITTRVLNTAKPGGVVLLHDGGGKRDSTVAALRPLIRALKAQGWRFSTPLKQAPVSPPP